MRRERQGHNGGKERQRKNGGERQRQELECHAFSRKTVSTSIANSTEADTATTEREVHRLKVNQHTPWCGEARRQQGKQYCQSICALMRFCIHLPLSLCASRNLFVLSVCMVVFICLCLCESCLLCELEPPLLQHLTHIIHV